MFSFGFEINEEGEAVNLEAAPSASAGDRTNMQPAAVTVDVSLDELLHALPARISFSPLKIPTSCGKHTISIPRRDLFDARFQIISGGEDDAAEQDATQSGSQLEFLDAPSDLVRGKYEGGLKTWECAADLIAVLADCPRNDWTSALEVGCGTAIPSAYVFGRMLSERRSKEASATRVIHVQDYNRLVLELVTVPNLLLAWYFSPASDLRDSHLSEGEAGELDIDDNLINAFQSSLRGHNIALQFTCGAWESWKLPQAFDLVLSSETVYEPTSLSALVRVLRDAGTASSLRLVAAKRVYFGVGGGLREFEQAVEQQGGSVSRNWETTSGVARAIVDVQWSSTISSAPDRAV
ncbi:hypothetical protein BKA62DRAFT_613907 [Auriculariales sp. MPI-PUGE-AT-0066]|nr:hypothetical protein BKA62DRAFT_613907 [Auriculariales sp. MPI-PUGE-AT-0066]